MMFPTEVESIFLKSPLINPSYPATTPVTEIFLYIAVRTTARIQAFIPGASPPEVKTAMCFIFKCKFDTKLIGIQLISDELWSKFHGTAVGCTIR